MKRPLNTKKQSRWMVLSLLLVTPMNAVADDPLLITAVKGQDHAAARELIARNVDVNETQLDGATALHWAVHRDDLDTAKLLIEAGANVNATNDLGVMPLSLACTNRNTTMVETLLKAGANSNAVLMTGESVLMTAAHVGDIDTVELLLRHGADVNATEPVREQTALMWALGENHTKIARRLVEQGADIHATTTLGFTPLLFAARAGDWEAVEMFLDAGADVNATATDNLSALHVAVLRGHGDVAALLLDRGADPNDDGPGYTALHWAVGTWETALSGKHGMRAPKGHEWDRMTGVKEGKFELVKALLEHGADPNALLQQSPVKYGYVSRNPPKNSTPFLLAASAGEADIMRLLVEHGADPSKKLDNGLTPLMIALGARTFKVRRVTVEDSLEAARVTVELGADVNERDRGGNTPMHQAAKSGSTELIQYLADNGAQVDVKNNRGQIPLYFAEHEFTAMTTVKIEGKPAALLLHKLVVPATIKNSMDEWSNIPRHIRDAVESLLQGELRILEEKGKK